MSSNGGKTFCALVDATSIDGHEFQVNLCTDIGFCTSFLFVDLIMFIDSQFLEKKNIDVGQFLLL